ncbi:hypothetical protein [Actinomadura miaoliensis]|uniref:Mce-associated membrane protein n=1 Tax=Actinomadura miaoliensis TaxID=430685 RepID=A0ABP7W3U2_9ACTN
MTDSEKTAAERPGGDGAAPPDRPRRRRRVRVIEVLDDEDLDEVLDAIEAEEEQDAEPAPRPVNGTKARPAKKAPPADQAAEDDEDDGEEGAAEDAEDAATPRRPARKTTASPATASADTSADADADTSADAPAPKDERPARQTFLGLGTGQAVAVVLLVAVLATLAVWQWRSASARSSTEDARDEVARVASAYGDAALTYNASNYRQNMAQAQRLMGGDLLEYTKSTLLSNLDSLFKNSPNGEFRSRTSQVFVGTVDERFATAVISVDITVSNAGQSAEEPATLLRLALSKIDGEWKVTRQYASGVNDQNRDGGTLGNVPGGTPSPSPSATSTGKDAKSGKDDKSGDGN